MQNPFRNRAQDDFGRQRGENERQTEFGPGEPRSWRDERQASDRYGREDRYGGGRSQRTTSQNGDNDAGWGRHDENRDWSRSSSNSDWDGDQVRQRYFGGSWDRGDSGHDSRYARRDHDDHRGSGSYGPESKARGRSDWRDFQDDDTSWETRSGRTDWTRGDRALSQYERGYERQGYAPGGQIWKDRDSRGDFEPDYLHWREQQLKSFDDDYSTWRNERRQKFSSDFDTWRSNRPKGVQTEAANPYVGDVSEGGTAEGDKLDHENKTGKARD